MGTVVIYADCPIRLMGVGMISIEEGTYAGQWIITLKP